MPLVVNAGYDTDPRAYLLLATTSGAAPGLPIGSVTLPLNGSRLLRYTLTNAGDADLLRTVGPLHPSGRAMAWFSPDPSTLRYLAGSRIEWSGLVFGPGGRSVLPPVGFDVLP